MCFHVWKREPIMKSKSDGDKYHDFFVVERGFNTDFYMKYIAECRICKKVERILVLEDTVFD